MKVLKKFLIGLLVGCTLMSSVACSPKGKYMDALKGKEGLFAVLTTEKGEIVMELFYKETPMTVAN
nr:peptidylprolyl isomerase [Treponema sp.]